MQKFTFKFASFVFILSPLITLCWSFQCFNDSSETLEKMTCFNATADKNIDRCIILKNSTYNWTYSCDDDLLCKGKQSDATHYVCRGEEILLYYCCSGDLCNTKQHLPCTTDANFTCPKNDSSLSCPSTYCTNTTVFGTPNSYTDCYHGYHINCSRKNGLPNQMGPSNGNIEMEWISCFNSCDHSSAPVDHRNQSSPTAPKTSARPVNVNNKTSGFSVGVVIGAILVLAAGVMLIGVGIKKCYERHLNKRLEYSYAQLTIDMLDDDDDHLILP